MPSPLLTFSLADFVLPFDVVAKKDETLKALARLLPNLRKFLSCRLEVTPKGVDDGDGDDDDGDDDDDDALRTTPTKRLACLVS